MFGPFGGGGGQGLYDAPQQPMQQTNPFTRGPVFGGGSGGFGGGFGGFGGFQQQSPFMGGQGFGGGYGGFNPFQQQSPYMGGQGFGGGYGGFNPFQQQMQMQNPFMGGQGFGGFGGFQQPMQQQYMPQQSFYGFGPGFGYGGQNQFDPRMQNPYGPPAQPPQQFQLPSQRPPQQVQQSSQPTPQQRYADFLRRSQQSRGNSSPFDQKQNLDDAARQYVTRGNQQVSDVQGKQQQLAQPQPQSSGDTFLGMPVGSAPFIPDVGPTQTSVVGTPPPAYGPGISDVASTPIVQQPQPQPQPQPQQQSPLFQEIAQQNTPFIPNVGPTQVGPYSAPASSPSFADYGPPMPQQPMMSQALAQQAAMDRSTPFDMSKIPQSRIDSINSLLGAPVGYRPSMEQVGQNSFSVVPPLSQGTSATPAPQPMPQMSFTDMIAQLNQNAAQQVGPSGPFGLASLFGGYR